MASQSTPGGGLKFHDEAMRVLGKLWFHYDKKEVACERRDPSPRKESTCCSAVDAISRAPLKWQDEDEDGGTHPKFAEM